MKKFAIIALTSMFIIFVASMIYIIMATGNIFIALLSTFIFGSIVAWFCIEVFSNQTNNKLETETNQTVIEYKVVKILDKYTIIGLDSSMNYPTFNNKEDAFKYKANLENETRENRE